MSAGKTTTDHETIRKWVEERGGRPARVAASAPGKSDGQKGSAGILRIDFAEKDGSLEEIGWDEFFEAFEEHRLAFVYQDEKDSRFVKLVSRE